MRTRTLERHPVRSRKKRKRPRKKKERGRRELEGKTAEIEMGEGKTTLFTRTWEKTSEVPNGQKFIKLGGAIPRQKPTTRRSQQKAGRNNETFVKGGKVAKIRSEGGTS